MEGIFSNPGFMPHIHCYLAKPALVWTMFASDTLIGMAYLSISLTLIALIRRVNLPFSFVAVCFGVFIGACGLTHFMEVWTLWRPDYWLAAMIKVITAGASVGTGVYLIKLRHGIVTVAEATKLSEQRRLDLELLNQNLERLVSERTIDLQRLNERLSWELEEKIKREQELEKTHTILKTIMNTSSDVIYVKDRASRMIYVNPATLQLIGDTADHVIGKNDVEFLGQKGGGEAILENDRRIMQNGFQESLEEIVVPRGKSRRVFLSNKAPYRNSHGEVIGLLGISKDITDLKEALIQTERQSAQLQAIFQAVSDGIAVFDMNGKLFLLNQAQARINGYPNPESMKRDLAYFSSMYELKSLDGSTVPTEEWPVSKVLRGESLANWQLHGLRKDTGHEWFFNFSGEPVIGENGKQVLAVVVTRDVTQQVMNAKKLEESEERFRALAENIPQLAWMTDEKGWISWYNQKWYNFTGTTLEQMQGWGWRIVHHPDHTDRVTKKWIKHLETGDPWEDTFPLRAKDGTYRWFLSRAYPVRSSTGKITRWFGTNTDITEQLNIQEDLKKIIQARDEFLSIASHELNTPLTTLKIQNQLLQRDISRSNPKAYVPERINTITDLTAKQLNRLQRLVDDMLDIARIRSGKLTIKKEKIYLCEFVKEVMDKLKSQFIEVGFPEPEFHCDGLSEGYWDKLRLEQVVSNLLTNALRYGNKRLVQVFIESSETISKIIVKDHGIGIDPESQKRIFNRFERAVDKNEVSGLGLGLFISQQIVSAHGGRIWVESALNQGSRFIVELPRFGASLAHFEGSSQAV
jgi:PAS domain S-box-containing protein